jgi:hypothetical protein
VADPLRATPEPFRWENIMAKRVDIDITELGLQLREGHGDKCLDFQTGTIVLAKDCSEVDSGEGRPALLQGKRFIRIPTLDEAYCEILTDNTKRDYRAAEEEFERFKVERESLKAQLSPEAREVIEAADAAFEAHIESMPEGAQKDALRATRSDPSSILSEEERERDKIVREEISAETVALRWIASLRPSFGVGWMDRVLGLRAI